MSKKVLNSNMTISDIAKKSGIPYSTVRDYVSGKRNIKKCNVETFLKLAQTMNVSMDELYKMWIEEKKEPKPTRSGKGLPEKFRGDFWDTTFEDLDTEYNKDFIIVRLFMHGGTPGVMFVNDTYSLEDIRHAIKTRRDLNPIVANYLSTTYDVQREEMIYYQFVHDTGNDWR